MPGMWQGRLAQGARLSGTVGSRKLADPPLPSVLGLSPQTLPSCRSSSSVPFPTPFLRSPPREALCVQQAELDYLSGRHKDTRRNSRLAFYYDLDKKQTRSVERHIRKMEFHISKVSLVPGALLGGGEQPLSTTFKMKVPCPPAHAPHQVDELYEGYCIQCRLRDGASNMQRAFSRCPPSRASRESLQELGRSLQECTEDMWLIEGALEVHLGEFHIRMKGLVGYARLCPGDQYEVLMRLGRQRWKLKGRIESDDSQTWDEEERAFTPTLHENFEIKVTELRGLSSLAVGTVTCDITDFFLSRPQVIVVDITELGTIKLQLEVLWNPFDTESCLVSPGPTGKFSVGSRKGSLYNWTPPSTPSFRERYYLSVLQPPAQQNLLLGGPKAVSILSYLSNSDLQGPGLRSRSQELPEMDSFSSEDPRDTETSTSASTSDVGFLPLAIGPNTSIEEEAQEDLPPLGLLPEMTHLEGNSFVEQPGWRNLEVESPNLSRSSPFYSHPLSGSQKAHDEEEPEDGAQGLGETLERPLQEVLDLLRALDLAQPQLRELECQVLGFRSRLKPCAARPERASADSLMECILENFAFLNADLPPQELSLFGGSRGPGKDRTPPPLPALPAAPGELTAGVSELDTLLTAHLQVCQALLQKLASPNLSSIVREHLLEEAAQQTQALETLSVLDFEKACKAKSIEETCRRLLEQVLSCSGLLPGAGPPEEQTVTWFQFHGYLQRHSVSDLEKHVAQLTKEVTLVEELRCPGRLKTIQKLQGKRLGQLQPLPQTLSAWALLQLDGTPRACRAASARLASAAGNRSFREKALLFYTDVLSGKDARLQQAACMALRHLRGVESIDQIASLCQSDLESVRAAAREATLSFGEGHTQERRYLTVRLPDAVGATPLGLKAGEEPAATLWGLRGGGRG
ncbi:RIPOR family member 3 [Galemys pyrenaicus]|uniref:RIPOR family member 3 n=1 Tax=Galemys pyrenaicus TaxID=202257 RepID=A0A8J6ALR8_GALPY|nr:RIPOR family member 3 [Galemys pyrenaicus]